MAFVLQALAVRAVRPASGVCPALTRSPSRSGLAAAPAAVSTDGLAKERGRGRSMAAVGLLARRGLRSVMAMQIRASSDQLGELGKGAGKGGGGGGAIREAGGAFGKKQAAEEEKYFRQKEQEQLASLKKHHQEEIDHHKKEIERLQKDIERHKKKIKKLDDDDDD